MSHRVTSLILALLGGCASQPPIVEAEVIPIGSVSANSTTGEPYIIGNEPGPLGSALAPLSSSSPPSPSAVASGRPVRPTPRSTGSFGVRPSPAPRPTIRSRPVIGRPLVVDGVVHAAPFTAPPAPASNADIEQLHRAARDEHASVAAFARTIAELMALGAPLSLLHETQAALGDEIKHTTMTLALLEKLTGERHVIAPLEAATATLQRSVVAFFCDVLRGGAVGETLAAADADARRERASDPALRAYYETIANDEARHAALAFKTLRWLLERHPDLATTMADELAGLPIEERTFTADLFAAIQLGPHTR